MTRRLVITGAGFAVVTLALLGCGGNEPDGELATMPPSTEPPITPPPAPSPEQEAEQEIIATFQELITQRDQYYMNAGDYGNDGNVAWNAELVQTWPVEAQANLELTNWVAAWRGIELEQAGETVVAAHDVMNIDLDPASGEPLQARSSACLDMTGLTFHTYEGASATPTPAFEPDQYQRWDMSWAYHARASPNDKGWYVQSIDLARNEPCKP